MQSSNAQGDLSYLALLRDFNEHWEKHAEAHRARAPTHAPTIKRTPTSRDLSLLLVALSASSTELLTYRVARARARSALRRDDHAERKKRYVDAADALIQAALVRVEQQGNTSPEQRKIWHETLSDLFLDL